MTNEELCLRYQAGDAEAAEELISRNMGLIRFIALRYAHDYQNARMDADDYTQEGAVALLRAASQFDPSREVQFLTYAGQAVRNAIIDAIRADNPNLVLTPLDEAHTGSADDNDDTDLFIGRMKTRLPSSYEADPETICIRKEQLEELYAAIHALPRAITPGWYADMALTTMHINHWRRWAGSGICPKAGRRRRRRKLLVN